MSEFYKAKFIELFTEFNRYLIEHPDFAEQIPEGAEVLLLDKSDPGYNRYVLGGIESHAPDHPVVYVNVGKLAPVRSRLRNPVVVTSPMG
jgi:hypothetical protein